MPLSIRAPSAYSAMSTSTRSGAGRSAERMSWWLMMRLPLVGGRNPARLRPGVIGARADDLAVGALLNDVRRPSGRPRDHEERREHGGRHAHLVVGDRAEPVEVREHPLDVPH